MLINKNFSLKKFNTFGINVYARYFVEVKSMEEIIKVINRYPNIPKVFLGNGSNILFLKKYYPGMVIKIGIKGKKIIQENDLQVIVQAYSGENWNEFVMWTIKKGFLGLENLSFIPGTVGAASIQNIGAYGSEIKDTLLKIQAYEIYNQKIIELTNKECQLGYRCSLFKNYNYKNKFIILSVFFILRKKCQRLNLSYVEVKKELENMKVNKPTVNDLINALFHIRNRKLPNLKKLGNAGSFFLNPIVDISYFKKVKFKYPTIVGYSVSNRKIKLSANSLIENTGWKGKKIGNAGVYEKHPIILVNYGEASGMDIFCLSKQIRKDIKEKFNILLSIEVNIIQ
ncbi:UDP-N-acetylmuramate dehydrogenase [Blattabacterium cuenoti]|uniref:UDP-N-acetylmuramate dehydrogenase n=1 Tax=Blattabacterium cuenoti TaxID=1653831 RepID=UPI00163CCA2F|nr:UDP-N-acetylmuramate dehydrogenase [Blattabacterium cuenoti]